MVANVGIKSFRLFEISHSAYDTDVKGYDADFKGYGADVKGYGAVVKGYDADVTGYGVHVKGYGADVKGYDAVVKGYDVYVTGYGADVKGYGAEVKSYSAEVTRATAERAPLSERVPFAQVVIEDCQQNGQLNPATMGSCSNVGLMAQKAEEYGSHDKTFEMEAAGVVHVKDTAGATLMEQPVQKTTLFARAGGQSVSPRRAAGVPGEPRGHESMTVNNDSLRTSFPPSGDCYRRKRRAVELANDHGSAQARKTRSEPPNPRTPEPLKPNRGIRGGQRGIRFDGALLAHPHPLRLAGSNPSQAVFTRSLVSNRTPLNPLNRSHFKNSSAVLEHSLEKSE
eukprot:1186302-Prorocentrum_minimum.AAC.3